jgi:hypothetical protein
MIQSNRQFRIGLDPKRAGELRRRQKRQLLYRLHAGRSSPNRSLPLATTAHSIAAVSR